MVHATLRTNFLLALQFAIFAVLGAAGEHLYVFGPKVVLAEMATWKVFGTEIFIVGAVVGTIGFLWNHLKLYCRVLKIIGPKSR